MKIKVKNIFTSVLLYGPLSGRPATFVVVGEGKKRKIDKIIKEITSSKSPSRLCVIRGTKKIDAMSQDLTQLIDKLLRAAYAVLIETDGKTDSDTIPFVPKSVFVIITPTSVNCAKDISTKYATGFRYIIRNDVEVGRDGLPKNVFKPKDNMLIMIEPAFDKNKAIFDANWIKAVNISMQYGFYLSFPLNKMMGIK